MVYHANPIFLHIAGPAGDSTTPQYCRRCHRVLRMQHYSGKYFYPLGDRIGERKIKGQVRLFYLPEDSSEAVWCNARRDPQ